MAAKKETFKTKFPLHMFIRRIRLSRVKKLKLTTSHFICLKRFHQNSKLQRLYFVRAERPLRSDPVRIDAAAASVLRDTIMGLLCKEHIIFVELRSVLYGILCIMMCVMREFCYNIACNFMKISVHCTICVVYDFKNICARCLTCEKYQQTKCKYCNACKQQNTSMI